MLIAKNFLTAWPSYKPSYLTSWSQLGPAGTTFLVVGIQNSECALAWAAFMHSPARNVSLSRGAEG
jgi:hypothetical protein